MKTEVQKEYVRKERIITKEKIIKETVSVSFKKLILGIWGSSEFGCELAYFIVRLTDNKVLLIDLDNISGIVDAYLGLTHDIENLVRGSPEFSPLCTLINYANENNLNIESFEKNCIKRKELPNLYVILGIPGASSQDEMNEKELVGFIDQAYRLFDLVILIMNPSVYDLTASAVLMKSDYLIAAFPASSDNIRGFENYLVYMKRKYNLPLDRVRYVAYEYKNNIHYPVRFVKEIFPGNCFLGTISYTKQREQAS